jgi:hypothetical protein
LEMNLVLGYYDSERIVHQIGQFFLNSSRGD